MIKFILKKHTGLSDYLLHFEFLIAAIAFVAAGLNLSLFFVDYNKTMSSFDFFIQGVFCLLIPFICFCVAMGFILFMLWLVCYLRYNIPYEKEIVYEKEKKYEVHFFPILYLKKYYHNGKIHREEGAAIIYCFEHQLSNKDKYYLNNIEIPKEKFESQKIKNKVSVF
jgi:hypothetical protein